MNDPEIIKPIPLSKIPLELGLRVIRPTLEIFERELFAEFFKASQIEAQIRKGYQC